MTTENALVPVTNGTGRRKLMTDLLTLQFTTEQKELAKKQLIIVASRGEDKKAEPTDDDAVFALAYCLRVNLDPFSRQIYCMKRFNKERNEYRLSFETGIDGFRVIAQRNPQYDGQSAPQWCGEDGKWKDIWLEKKAPAAARVLVYRKDISHPFVGIAFWSESNKGTSLWNARPASQLVKCAEANGLRKAFPNDFSGLYIPEEMPPVSQVPQDSENIIPPSFEIPLDDTTNMLPITPPPPSNSQNGNGKSSDQPAHYEKEDELVYKERCRLFNKTIAYMKEKNISAPTVKATCKELGIERDSLHMLSQEFVQLLNTLQERQETLEKQQAAKDAQEHTPLTQEETTPPPVNNDPPAPFTPPDDPFDAPKEEVKKN